MKLAAAAGAVVRGGVLLTRAPSPTTALHQVRETQERESRAGHTQAGVNAPVLPTLASGQTPAALAGIQGWQSGSCGGQSESA